MAENKADKNKNNKERKKLEIKELETDVLIIGGGTAGCYAAITLGKNSDLSVIVAEKANIKRSGCLAAGINAIRTCAAGLCGLCGKRCQWNCTARFVNYCCE